MGAVLKLADLHHRRGTREVLAIERLDVAAGERLAVLGPNGAGKTTLLRLLAGLETPSAGRVEIDGVGVSKGGHELRRRIAYATQRPQLLSTSVRRNVELPLRWRGVARAERRRIALEALGRLGVAHLAERRAAALSGGEAQRVSLARALAIEPDLLLLDEPAAGLDAEARGRFLDDLEAALRDGRVTVLHVSHRADEALRLADRVAILSGGVVRQLGTPSSVVRRPADATVAKLVGYENVVPVEIDQAGQVLVAGVACGLAARDPAGAGTLVAWAGAIRIAPRGRGPLEATVERVSPGPGRWEVVLAAGETLRAQLPLNDVPPRAGERVSVSVDPTHATVISDPAVPGLKHMRAAALGDSQVKPSVP
jgi:ABC-type sulfate/molybdate transport systems ATPase subunit